MLAIIAWLVMVVLLILIALYFDHAFVTSVAVFVAVGLSAFYWIVLLPGQLPVTQPVVTGHPEIFLIQGNKGYIGLKVEASGMNVEPSTIYLSDRVHFNQPEGVRYATARKKFFRGWAKKLMWPFKGWPDKVDFYLPASDRAIFKAP